LLTVGLSGVLLFIAAEELLRDPDGGRDGHTYRCAGDHLLGCRHPFVVGFHSYTSISWRPEGVL
jgi:hypothetical protein